MRSAATPQIAVAVPTYEDDPRVLALVLDGAVRESPGQPVIVIDMSPAATARPVCESRPGVRFEHFPSSRGLSDSRNRAVELAGTRFLAFLDADAIPRPGWLAPLAACLGEEAVAVVGSRVVAEWERRPGRLLRTATAADWLSLFDLGGHRRDVPRIMGTSHALDLELVPDPPYDPDLGLGPGRTLGMEEVRLCERVRREGGRVVYEPLSVVGHRIPARRATWRAIWRRAYSAGREARTGARLEQLPRPRFGLADQLFRVAVTPPFLAGALLGLRAPRHETAPGRARSW